MMYIIMLPDQDYLLACDHAEDSIHGVTNGVFNDVSLQ